jgi:2-polyprenyl-6-methoxyphenol hydroxylase-like FAD-dependent oxidoreductase
VAHTPEQSYDVVVVGAGPTGMTVANLLALYGHQVAVIERHPSLYGLPRAGHLDHEAIRTLQSIDCHGPVLADALPRGRNRWLNAQGEVMFEFDHWEASTSFHPSVSLYQPVLEDALFSRLEQAPNVDLWLGWTVTSHTQRSDTVHLSMESDSETMCCGARYVVAADGAGSSMRNALGIERDDYGFNERWMTVDVAYRQLIDFGPPAVVGDPNRPHFYGGLGKRHHRFEWQLLPGESVEEFSRPDRAWEMLAPVGATPDNVQIVRQTVFEFEYRTARKWRDQRIVLLGDAAHTMPPCLGQGMCSGVRDAANIAWKIDLVLRGLGNADLLDTYQSERLPNVKAWSDMALRAGRIAFTTDHHVAAERDSRLRRGEKPDFGPTPVLGPGLIAERRAGEPVGEPFPQRHVRHESRAVLFDDVVGPRFSLVVAGEAAPASDWASLAPLGFTTIELSPEIDVDDFYLSWFAKNGITAALVRPDRQIFGTADKTDAIPDLLAALQQGLANPTIQVGN